MTCVSADAAHYASKALALKKEVDRLKKAKPRVFTKNDVIRAVKGVQHATGATTRKVEIARDKITVEVGEEQQQPEADNLTPLQKWRLNHARKKA